MTDAGFIICLVLLMIGLLFVVMYCLVKIDDDVKDIKAKLRDKP